MRCRSSGGQVPLGAAGDELEQQLVELGDHPGVVLTQGATPVGQDPQHGLLLVVTTGRSPFIRSATSAIAWASSGSVLRPWRVSNIRNFGGTSTTVSPAMTSRAATDGRSRCSPRPPTAARATAGRTEAVP